MRNNKEINLNSSNYRLRVAVHFKMYFLSFKKLNNIVLYLMRITRLPI